MTQFYISPDQIPGGVPQSEPTEIAALKIQVQKMREMLKRLEWADTGFVFSTAHQGDIKVHRCPICNYSREYYGWTHSEDCELAALLKETE